MHSNGDADALYEMGCAYEDADGVELASVPTSARWRGALAQVCARKEERGVAPP